MVEGRVGRSPVDAGHERAIFRGGSACARMRGVPARTRSPARIRSPCRPASRANPLPYPLRTPAACLRLAESVLRRKASRLVKCCLLEGLALEERQIGIKRHQVDRARFGHPSRKARKPEFNLRKPHSDIRPRRHAFWAKPFLGCGQTYVNGVQRRRDVLPKRTGPLQGSCLKAGLLGARIVADPLRLEFMKTAHTRRCQRQRMGVSNVPALHIL